MQTDRLKIAAKGRWPGILAGLGIPARHLTGRHGPCPCCGGRDRFRFDDHRGEGGFFCSKCGPGDGFKLVMRARGVTFVEAKRLVEEQLPAAPIVKPKPKPQHRKDFAVEQWGHSLPLHESDPVARYLAKRGLKFRDGFPPKEIKYRAATRYYEEGEPPSTHPAMIARFVAPDVSSWTLHTTYLTPAGEKAKVRTVRKMAPGPVPQGGAVRLAYSNGDTLGIAEGIETALAASMLHDVPVWAALNEGNLRKWQPPSHIRNVIIFGDNDDSLVGQEAAWVLGKSLRMSGLRVEVRIPDIVDHDWNDMVCLGRTNEFGKLGDDPRRVPRARA